MSVSFWVAFIGFADDGSSTWDQIAVEAPEGLSAKTPSVALIEHLCEHIVTFSDYDHVVVVNVIRCVDEVLEC